MSRVAAIAATRTVAGTVRLLWRHRAFMPYDVRELMLLRVVPFALVALLAALPVAPPEHLHDVVGADGHHEVVSHRHMAWHGSASTPAAAAHVDHADQTTLSVDGSYTAPGRFVNAVPAVPVVMVSEMATRVATMWETSRTDTMTCGPPRAPAALRAPPARLA